MKERSKKIRIFKIVDRGVNKEDRYIPDYDDLAWVVGVFQADQLKVGYTSGVYDMFHVGHAKYLEKAKEACDMLIVAVDSDELVKQDKGPKRPIVNLEERIEILLRNRSVDVITVRNVGDDPFMLIKKIKPDLVVFSESTQDRRPNFINEMKEAYKDDVKDIIVLPPQAETSTTATIRLLTLDSSKELGAKIVALVEDYFKDGKEGGKL